MLLMVHLCIKTTGNNYLEVDFTAAGVVRCGPKTSPRTSSKVQFIIFFRTFEIGKNI